MKLKRRIAAGMIAGTLALVSPVSVMAESLNQTARVSVNVDSKETKDFLDRFFNQEATMKKTSAGVVSVVKDGTVIAESGYGKLDKSSGQAVDPVSTTFRVGSISKVFTVIGLMQLVDQGKVRLDDNIEKYLGGYKVNNPFDKPVTVEMLLTHSTGFEVRDPTSDNILFDPSQKPISLKESVFAVFPPVVREPGTSYMYDNFASELVGYIVQEVSGTPFNEYMLQNVFKPLGMTSSTFDPSGELVKRLPQAYGLDGEKVPDYRLSPDVLPEGSMITTAADMSRFMIAYMNGGKTTEGKTILSPASLQAMSSYHLSIHEQVPDMTYGFEAPAPLDYANGRNIIAKGGSIPGFESYLFMLPEEKTAVFVSLATESDLILHLFDEFMDRFYPGKATFGDPQFKPQAKSKLKRFEGIYADLRIPGMLTSIEINEDGTLTSGDNAGQRMNLKQTEELLFVDENGHPMAFKEDGKGEILYIKYSNPGSYAAKLTATGLSDIPNDHPYAKYIYGLQSLGLITGDMTQSFRPEEKVSREAFIRDIIHQFNLPPSPNEPIFQDVAESPYAAEIQAAVELGLLKGTGNGKFEPDRPIKREEAAVIVMNLLEISGYQVKENHVELTKGTSPWAEQAVRTVIDLQMHGKEVTVKNGLYDYGSKRDLTNQEFAAIQYLLLLPEKSLTP